MNKTSMCSFFPNKWYSWIFDEFLRYQFSRSLCNPQGQDQCTRGDHPWNERGIELLQEGDLDITLWEGNARRCPLPQGWWHPQSSRTRGSPCRRRDEEELPWPEEREHQASTVDYDPQDRENQSVTAPSWFAETRGRAWTPDRSRRQPTLNIVIALLLNGDCWLPLWARWLYYHLLISRNTCNNYLRKSGSGAELGLRRRIQSWPKEEGSLITIKVNKERDRSLIYHFAFYKQ